MIITGFLSGEYSKSLKGTDLPKRFLGKRKNQWNSIGFCLVQRKGFEPPTDRFVADYSIQLSYHCLT